MGLRVLLAGMGTSAGVGSNKAEEGEWGEIVGLNKMFLEQLER